MHELSMVKEILHIVFLEMKKENLTVLKRLEIRAGGLSQAEVNAMKFAFAERLSGTPSAGAVLDVIQPAQAKCGACGAELSGVGLHDSCPKCGAAPAEHADCHDVEIISMEALP